MSIKNCARCNGPFGDHEEMAHTGQDEYWHLRCFVCAQCFRPFNDDHEYYKFNGRMYCERDFRTLFAPSCSKCNQFIIGRFIRALNRCWHPNCFLCNECQLPLADHGFVKTSKDTALCHDCNISSKTATKDQHFCYKCQAPIADDEKDTSGEPFRIRNETYHAYHFNCAQCGIELRPDARQVKDDLYCLRCHDKMGIPICGACRTPIEGRVVTALGKQWHSEHFACASCDRPFHGKRHFEVKGLAYCEEHYYDLFGHRCDTCCQVIDGDVVSALGKFYCSNHFSCHFCVSQLKANKSEFYNVNSYPCCRKCYKKFPAKLRKQLADQQKYSKAA